MTRKFVPLLIFAVLIAGLGWLAHWKLSGTDKRHGHHFSAKPLAVETAMVKVQPMPLFLQAVGQVQSEHSVKIRPQVSGQLLKVFFSEGDEVKKGQKLFLIDPSQYQTAMEAARAELEYDQQQAKRLAPLAGKEFVTTQEYENARATVDQARAKLQQAQINLAYTDIRAPISGRTGTLGAKPGNLVAPGDTGSLVTINQMQPILVQYSIPQQSLSELRRYQAQGSIRIFITHENGSGDLGEGKLVFVDNAINTDTGTVMLKARVPNAHEQLWPGQYVGVRTRLTLQPNAVTIPQTAVQTGQKGNYVYVIEQGKAAVRDVEVDRQVGEQAVIASGLKGGETVVTRVPRNLRPGGKVESLSGDVPRNPQPKASPQS